LSDAVVARGATLEQAFIEVALATYTALAGPADVQSGARSRTDELREVRAHGSSFELLLDRWIAECCYVHEVEGFVGRAIEFAVFSVGSAAGGEPMRLHAFLRGEVLSTHDIAARVIRGISAADRPIQSTPEGFEIRLVVET
jgi:SHS2 domain-containing protein